MGVEERRADLMREMLQKAKPYFKNDFEKDVVHRKIQYNDGYDGYEYDYGEVADDEYGFDMTSFSLKYSRCQMVKSFSDEAIQQGASSVLVSSSLVVFRLCPTQTCRSSNGNGCSSDYGEYVLPLDEYLYYMSVFNDAKEKHYCQWCKQCLQNQNNRKRRRRHRRLEGNADYEDADADADYENADADADYEDADADADYEDVDENEGEVEDYEDANEYGEDEQLYDDGGADEAQDEATQSCPSECNYYSDRCENNNNDDSTLDYEDYLNCKKYRTYDKYGNKLSLYVGAYCSSDHSTIKVDVFYDQFCTNYAGNDHDVNTITGLQFEDSGLSDFYPEDCIPCKESVSSFFLFL